MEKRSRRRIRNLVALAAFKGLSENEIGCARISMMARSTNAPFKGRIQKRKTNRLQIIKSSLQRTAGPYKSASRGHQHDLFVSLASIHPQRQWARGQSSSFASCVVLTTLGFDADLNQQSCDRAA